MLRLLPIFLIISVSVFGQDLPKGAEAIQVTTNLTDAQLFERVVTVLTANDYVIDKSDAERGTIVTDHKASSGAMSMRILATVKNGAAVLKGQWSATAMGYTFTNEPVRNKGMAGSNEKKSFAVLNKVALQLSQNVEGVTVQYILPTK